MKTLPYACFLFLLGTALVVMADPTTACPPPPSGTGVTTCNGNASVIQPDTDNGPVCFNTTCPGYHTESAPGTCVQGWNGGQGTKPVCVALSPY